MGYQTMNSALTNEECTLGSDGRLDIGAASLKLIAPLKPSKNIL